MRATTIVEMIPRALLGILLLAPVRMVAASSRLDDSPVVTTSPLRSRKSHPRLNTDINMTTFSLQSQQQRAQQPPSLQSQRPLSLEELEEERQARQQRSLERKARMRQAFADIPPPSKGSMEAVSQEEFQSMQQKIKEQAKNNNNNGENGDNKSRQLSWFGRGSNSGISTVSETYLVDPSQEYDKWAQAYRMLGGYIDCDYKKQGNNHHSGDNNNKNDNNGDVSCSRWMIWASVRFSLLQVPFHGTAIGSSAVVVV
jgi:hypothetical protein